MTKSATDYYLESLLELEELAKLIESNVNSVEKPRSRPISKIPPGHHGKKVFANRHLIESVQECTSNCTEPLVVLDLKQTAGR